MIKLLRYMKAREWTYFAILVCFVVISVWCTLTMPDYMTKITQLVETGGDMAEIWKYGGIMLAFAIGDAICTVVVGFCTAKIAAYFSQRLRKAVYDRTVAFSMQEINNFSTSSLVTRTTNDIGQVIIAISMGMQVIMRAPIIAVWSVFKIIDKGWQWVLVTVIAVVIVAGTIVICMIVATPRFKLIQMLTDKLNLVTRENLTGVRVVRAYNAEHYQEVKFDKANQEMTDNHLFTGRVMAYLSPTIQLVMSCTSLAVYWIGAHIIMNTTDVMGKIDNFSKLVVFMAYAMQLIMAFMMVAMVFIILPRAIVAANRINEVLDIEPKILDGEFDNSTTETGTVEFRNVSFSYPDAEEAVLKDITFKANKGETVAFIGSTGSGKSTLINLVPRFFDTTEGEVLVDGMNVREYKQADLHDKIGYVSQKAILFKGTIASNIDYGENADVEANKDKIIHAMEVAQGKDILEKQEEGIYAEVAQGGTNFSGGQKQRISIARAVFKNPEIFIFDDSFSALDYKTDKVLRACLKKDTESSTTLVVAQRIGTVKDADKIIVLDEGRIVGMGTHEELIKSCEVYQQIAYSQLSKEELLNA